MMIQSSPIAMSQLSDPAHDILDLHVHSAEVSLGSPKRLTGTSQAIERLRRQLDRLGPHFRRVLISGEAGSDRERIARALWAACPGNQGPFINVAHGDLEEIASLWWQDTRVARMALRRLASSAAGGMVWIDDIGTLSSAAQTLLLRLTEEQPATGERPRIAAGTTANLKHQAAARTFSHALHLALASVEILVPPLRDRLEDLPVLAWEIIHSIALEYALTIKTVAHDVLDRLSGHPWTGNETELENVLRMAVLSCSGGHLRAEHLPALDETSLLLPQQAEAPDCLQEVIDQHLLRVLARCDGNKLRAAERLGISRSTLYRMLEACAAQQATA